VRVRAKAGLPANQETAVRVPARRRAVPVFHPPPIVRCHEKSLPVAATLTTAPVPASPGSLPAMNGDMPP
jgi:hypothetical protein